MWDENQGQALGCGEGGLGAGYEEQHKGTLLQSLIEKSLLITRAASMHACVGCGVWRLGAGHGEGRGGALLKGLVTVAAHHQGCVHTCVECEPSKQGLKEEMPIGSQPGTKA